jgi:hypothetical protein
MMMAKKERTAKRTSTRGQIVALILDMFTFFLSTSVVQFPEIRCRIDYACRYARGISLIDGGGNVYFYDPYEFTSGDQ